MAEVGGYQGDALLVGVNSDAAVRQRLEAASLRPAGAYTALAYDGAGLMLDTLAQDYIRTARAKGLRERVVLFRHALRNALIPAVTVMGINMGILLGGSAVIDEHVLLGRFVAAAEVDQQNCQI